VSGLREPSARLDRQAVSGKDPDEVSIGVPPPKLQVSMTDNEAGLRSDEAAGLISPKREISL
jgi:hypothetical protein